MKHLKYFERNKYYTNKNKPDYIKFSIGDYVKMLPWGTQTNTFIYKIKKISENDIPTHFQDQTLKVAYEIQNIENNNSHWVWEHEIELAPEEEVAMYKYNL